MTTIWRPDTCDCIIEYNKNIRWIRTIKACRLHENLRGQTHLDQVLGQNQRFNLSHGSNPNETEREDLTTSKEINKERIKKENLDNFHEHLPEHHSRLSLRNLRRVLRI